MGGLGKGFRMLQSSGFGSGVARVISTPLTATILVFVVSHDRILKSYLNPEEPAFLGFLTMISLYKSLKR